VIDVIAELRSYGVEVAVHDPAASADDARREYGIELQAWDKLPRAQAAILAVSHREFSRLTVADFAEKLTPGGCLIDVKSALPAEGWEAAGLRLWRL
jgi:UDP-N-acetyl-D-galactosamine dehydrogenase